MGRWFDQASDYPWGMAPLGTLVDGEPIIEGGVTAYRVGSVFRSRWVSHVEVHGRPGPVSPLVELGGW